MNTKEKEKSIASVVGAIALLILGSLSMLGGILFTIEIARNPGHTDLLVIAISSIIVGTLSLVAARSPGRLKERPVYFVFLSLILQMILMSEEELCLVLLVMFLHFSILLSIAFRYRTNIVIRVFLMGYLLAGLSAFVYQRTGPAIGVYGTECGEPPNHLCYGPVLGAGFPLQYVVDRPTISIPQKLGLEDNVRGLSLAIDILVYSVAIFLSYKLVQSFRSRGTVLSCNSP
jgi:hypothetical protein